MKYFMRLFSMRGFKIAPVQTVANAVHLAVLLMLKRGAVIRIPFGSTSFAFDYVHGKRFAGGRGLFIDRQYIEELMEFGDRFLCVGDTVIDGGANQGVFTTAFASYVGATGKVVAIEPMPYAVERIKQNAALNNASDHVHVVNAALSNLEGEATLDLTNGVGSASITNDYGGSETTTVRTSTIDQIVAEQKLDGVNFIKLDIEGAELKALEGAAQTLAAHHPVICMEISTGSGTNSEIQAHDHLLTLGYEPLEFVDRELLPLKKLSPPHANVFYMYPKHDAAVNRNND